VSPERERTQYALTIYPLSRPFLERVEQTVGPVRVGALVEIRQGGAGSVLRALARVTASNLYVVAEDASVLPLVPVLRLLAACTRARRFRLVTPGLEVVPFSRFTAARDAGQLALGTLRGLGALARCWLELKRLARSPRRPVASPHIRRVAYLKTTLWAGLKVGGSVGHVAGVVNALAGRLARVDVLAPEALPLVRADVVTHRVAQSSAQAYPYELNYFAYHRRFVARGGRILEELAPDALYQRLSIGNYAGVVLARRLRIPLVLEYNGSEVWVARHWGRGLRFPGAAMLAEEVSLRHADLIVTVSDVLGDELRARGIDEDRILVYPNCVDPSRFDPSRFSPAARRAVRARYGIAPDAIVAGFIGTFGQWHGITLLARAVAEMARASPAWLTAHRLHFLLIGDGVLMPEVRRLLAAPGLERFVTLTGLVPQDDAPAHLAAADILLSPHVPNPDGSRFFGSPTKLFEYMAMGKPIIAGELEQIGRVLSPAYRAAALPSGPPQPGDPRMAILIVPGDLDELIRAIRFLVEHPEYREPLGANARAAVLARYTWDRNVEAVLARAIDPDRAHANHAIL
jgi:glycosyltransferase involved in cell wall biosynthesis